MEHLTDAIGGSLPRKVTEDLGMSEKVCPAHGPYQASGYLLVAVNPHREVWSQCPACKLADAERDRIERHQAVAAAHVQALERMLHQTALPGRFIGRTLQNYQAQTEGQAKALSICTKYAERFDDVLKRGSSLILSGLPGTGKSHLAGGILQAILPRHIGIYVTMMDLIRMLRDTWRRDSEQSESDVLAKLAAVPLLVIDEVGAQYGTDAERTLFFDVMDRRYRNCMPVILMTNQGMADFKVTVGDRVYDRLTEVAKWVAFDWSSYRTQARKESQQ